MLNQVHLVLSLRSLCKFFKRRMGITAKVYRMMSEEVYPELSLTPSESKSMLDEE